MPFAEIIEPRKVIACAGEELLQCFFMILRATDETRAISTRPLHGNINNPKHLIADMLAHQQAADLPVTRTF